MKNSPLNELLSATDLDKIQESLILIFGHISRKLSPRKRNGRFIPIKIFPAHAKLQERTRYLGDWRKQHEQLAVMTGPTKGLGGVGMEVGGTDMEEEVKEAYEVVKRIDVLDVSVGMCWSLQIHWGGWKIYKLQRVRRSRSRLKMPIMNGCLVWKTRLLLVCVTG